MTFGHPARLGILLVHGLGVQAQSLLADVNPNLHNPGSSVLVIGQAGVLTYPHALAAESPVALWRTEVTSTGTIPLAFPPESRTAVYETGDLDGSGRVLISATLAGTPP